MSNDDEDKPHRRGFSREDVEMEQQALLVRIENAVAAAEQAHKLDPKSAATRQAIDAARFLLARLPDRRRVLARRFRKTADRLVDRFRRLTR